MCRHKIDQPVSCSGSDTDAQSLLGQHIDALAFCLCGNGKFFMELDRRTPGVHPPSWTVSGDKLLGHSADLIMHEVKRLNDIPYARRGKPCMAVLFGY